MPNIIDEIKSKLVHDETRIEEIKNLFDGKTILYIDYANVINWTDKWHIDLERVKIFFESFPNVKSIKFFYGLMPKDGRSKKIISKAEAVGFKVFTKPVKKIKIPIYAQSIPIESTAILKNFIKKPLLKRLSEDVIKKLNQELIDLNNEGVYYIEDKKCNFDVEIGREIEKDSAKIDTFVLWSGDSDFAEPIEKLLADNKKVILVCTAGKVASELNKLVKKGLTVFEINKIKNSICRERELEFSLAENTISEFEANPLCSQEEVASA